MNPSLTIIADALAGPINDPSIPALSDPQRWRNLARAALDDLDLTGPIGTHLTTLATGDLAPGLLAQPGRAVLVGELARNLIDPGRINQGRKGTCASACVECWLAEALPEEYARLIAGLAAAAGTVELKSGRIMRRDEEQLVWSEEEAGRSPVSRLFQAASMELAYPELDYCNLTDHQQDAGGEQAGYGLKLEAFDELLEVITGQRWDMVSDLYGRLMTMLGLSDSNLPDLQRDGPTIIARSLRRGQPVFVTLKLSVVEWEGETIDAGHITHKVRLVDKVGERVTFDDPLNPEQPWFVGVETVLINAQGRASMTMDDLMTMIVELSYQPRFWRAA